LLVSFELDEIMNLCDRIVAISKGEAVGIVDAKHADEREIGAMMAGMRTFQTTGTTDLDSATASPAATNHANP
jgi:ABC-type sugar transport system ATPase subunit